jgi:hypothetical protein
VRVVRKCPGKEARNEVQRAWEHESITSIAIDEAVTEEDAKTSTRAEGLLGAFQGRERVLLLQ